MLSYILVIILSLVIIYMGMIFLNTSVLMLGFCLILITVLALIYNIVCLRKIGASINIPIALSELGRTTKLELIVENSMSITIHKLRVKVEYGEKKSNKRRKKRIWIKDAIPGKKSFINEIVLNEVGNFYFEIRKLRIYDVTGLFYLDKRINLGESTMILPEIQPLMVQSGEKVRNFFGDADVYDESRSGFDPSEIFDVRDYRPGDRMQNVHWKLTAKMDDIIIRENSLPKACPVVLMIDPKGYSKKYSLDFYGFLAGLSFSIMDAGCPHYVAWKKAEYNDVVRMRVDDEESYYTFLTRFLIDNVPGVAEEYQEKYRGENYVHKLVLWGDGKLSIDGDKARRYKLDEFELVL